MALPPHSLTLPDPKASSSLSPSSFGRKFLLCSLTAMAVVAVTLLVSNGGAKEISLSAAFDPVDAALRVHEVRPFPYFQP